MYVKYELTYTYMRVALRCEKQPKSLELRWGCWESRGRSDRVGPQTSKVIQSLLLCIFHLYYLIIFNKSFIILNYLSSLGVFVLF